MPIHMKTRHLTIAHGVLLGAMVTLSLAGCGKRSEAVADDATPAQQSTPAQKSAPGLVVLAANAPELSQITLEQVRTVPMPGDQIVAPARIEANPNHIGRAVLPVAGRIVRVLVKLGDTVTKGQPLLTVVSTSITEAEAGFVQAEAALRQAELAAAKADADLVRLTDLLEHQAVAQKEVLAARTASELAKAVVDQARSARDQARKRLELLGLSPGHFDQAVTVSAPLSGKVLDVNVVDGEFRNEISTPLVTIANLSRVWATSEVPESKIRYCKLGGTADLELIAFPDATFRGRVTRIADTVDPETRTIKVSAELDNPSGTLRPEMYGRLRYSDGVVPTLWVPTSAVVRIGEKDFVFVQQGPGRFMSTPVELGQRHDDGYAVASGLRAGDSVVTQGSIYLKAAL